MSVALIGGEARLCIPSKDLGDSTADSNGCRVSGCGGSVEGDGVGGEVV